MWKVIVISPRSEIKSLVFGGDGMGRYETRFIVEPLMGILVCPLTAPFFDLIYQWAVI